jgi:hypothetical protein
MMRSHGLNRLAQAAHRLFSLGVSSEAPKQVGVTPQFDMPHGRLDFREGRFWVVVPAPRVGTEDVVTVDMTFEQWLELPPVQYVVKLELSRQQPRRPTGAASGPPASLPVPHGYMEWRDGQNCVILTAYRTGTEEPATLEFTLWQWLRLVPVRSAVEERLERWQWNKARQLGEI